MRLAILLATLAAVVVASPADSQNLTPTGGGGYSPPVGVCVTPAQQRQIETMLATNIRTLTQLGVLPPAGSQRPNTVPLSWPLRQANGFSYNSIYAISNYVDHNTAYPNQVLDWNCGSRTYDLSSGYNHAGMDIFLWPFDINMMNSGQAEIVAAAPGIIVGRYDGNFDRNCIISNSNWNAVYVQHADGSVAWYGHMKTGSLTTKALGASVAVGEFLGTVGSSGSSTGPHLHFELHDASGNVLDPYNGTCSTVATSWATQKPYYEPTINTLMTHSAPPVLETCPRAHTTNASNTLAPGATAYFAAYYHDQQQGQSTNYAIYRPNNTVFASWSHNSSAAHYDASYWYWTYTMPTTPTPGTWRFTATFQGNTVTHNFTVGAAPTATTAARPAAFALYPNPAQHRATLTLVGAPVPGAEALIHNQLGEVVSRQAIGARQAELTLPAAPGLYLVTVPTADGPVTQKLLVE